MAPVDQRYPFDGEEVRVRGLPGQIFNGPLVVITGSGGVLAAETVVATEFCEQPLVVVLTE